MNPIWLIARISIGRLGLLLALSGFMACSEHDSAVSANQAGSSHSAGTFSVGAPSSAGGMGGASPIANGETPTTAGAFGQAGISSSAGAGGTNPSAAPSTELGGATGVPGAGTAGAASGSAGTASSGFGSMAGAAGSSAAFTRVATILGKNCGIKGCHADKETPHFVPGAMLYETLTGPNTVLAECGYTKLIEAGDPSKSALVRLMNRKCDDFTMPPSCKQTTCLAAADLKTLSDWIQAGALP